MPAAILQYVFRPNPGIDMADLMALVKESATLWKKHARKSASGRCRLAKSATCHSWLRFESAAKLGATVEAINTDPAFAAWRAKNLKAGLATWVRSNQAYEISLQ